MLPSMFMLYSFRALVYNQIIQTAIIDRNIKVGHDEHFFIFVYCHRGPTINHRLIGMNFYISLHLLVTWKCFVWFNFKQSNIILCIIFSRLIRIWQQYPHVSGGVSDCLLRSSTVCNAFLRIGSADHKTHMVLTNHFTETSTELTHEKMSFFLKNRLWHYQYTVRTFCVHCTVESTSINPIRHI